MNQHLQNKLDGMLYGLVVGDCLGVPLEFRKRDTLPLVTDMMGGGSFGLEVGEWTDDSSMAFALLDSLQTCHGFDAKDVMQRFLQWYREGKYTLNGFCFDIGIQTAKALKHFEKTGLCYGKVTEDTTASGNGSIMRLAPVVIHFHDDMEKMIEAAAAQSIVTHPSILCVEACQIMAVVCRLLMDDKPLDEALKEAKTMLSISQPLL